MTCLNFGVRETPTLTIFAEVFDDNNSLYLLTTNHHLTEKSGWLNAKFHHYWEHINAGGAKVLSIASGDQKK